MSEYERPDRLQREPTMEDMRQLMGASTPHFALQIRNRIRNLIDGLPARPSRRGSRASARSRGSTSSRSTASTAARRSPASRLPSIRRADMRRRPRTGRAAPDRPARRRAPDANGYIDLLPTAGLPSTGPDAEPDAHARRPEIYERWWRPALGRAAKGVFGPGMADEQRIARLLLGLVPGDGVLDIACGTGNFTRDFARAVGPTGLVVGLDARPRCSSARSTTPAGWSRSRTSAATRRTCRSATESFDAVCCFAALHLFADPMKALDSITRVLTPGGRVAIFTSCRDRSAPLRTWASLMARPSGMRMFERDEIVDALEDRGFTQIRQRVAGVTQFVGGRLAG